MDATDKSWLSEIHSVETDLLRTANTIESTCFDLAMVLGEQSPAFKRLSTLPTLLREMHQRISDATGTKLNEDMHNAQQTSTTLLRACLAGMFVGKGTPLSPEDEQLIVDVGS